MNDWLSKVSNVINQKKASGYSNFYGYEIWNEPDGTWASTSVNFNDMWLQTYKLIRSSDPKAQIIGPSYELKDPLNFRVQGGYFCKIHRQENAINAC